MSRSARPPAPGATTGAGTDNRPGPRSTPREAARASACSDNRAWARRADRRQTGNRARPGVPPRPARLSSALLGADLSRPGNWSSARSRLSSRHPYRRSSFDPGAEPTRDCVARHGMTTWCIIGRGLPMPEINPAASWPNYREDDFVIKDYRFASGEVLPELRLHCRTMGTPRRDSAGKIVNGVLLLQGNTGTGANWLRPSLADELYGPGQPLDATQYFFIMQDAI